MLNYKWHHFHSYVASVMCQESSILNSEPAKLHLWYLLWTIYNTTAFVSTFEEHQILYKVFSRILCPSISVSLCKLSHNRLTNRVYPLLSLLENLTWGKKTLWKRSLYVCFIHTSMNEFTLTILLQKESCCDICVFYWSLKYLAIARKETHLCKLV